ncbi:MucB/RseB C-terminal domain-containing protein [Chitinibacteraceae bacterium HSL-7]
MRLFPSFCLALSVAAPLAAAQPEVLEQGAARALLEKVAQAPARVNYQGVYIHRYGERLDTVRIIHAGSAKGEQERRETLDGPPLELVRNGDRISLYLAEDGQLPQVDHRSVARMFPRQLPQNVETLLAAYRVKKLGGERVAGRQADIIELEPRDVFRYPHRFWIDPDTGLMLKAVAVGDGRQVVEMQAFSQVEIGGHIDQKLLKPRHEVRPLSLQGGEKVALPRGWRIKSLPAGFVLVKQRASSAGGRTVEQHVYSDGLATVSVFAEPVSRPVAAELSHRNGVSVFVRQEEGFAITVVGEVPAEAVQAISNAYVRLDSPRP